MVWGDAYKVQAFCEIDSYCQKVLKKHWPDVPIENDIKELDGKEYAGTVDIITGGFPCQPFSISGLRRGAGDNRALWPQMLRVIEYTNPHWVMGENVLGITSIQQPISPIKVESRQARRFVEADNYHSILSRQEILYLAIIIEDLQKIGYELPEDLSGTPIVFIVPAIALDARHIRKRVWIISHAKELYDREGAPRKGGGSVQQSGIGDFSPNMADTNGAGCKKCDATAITAGTGYRPRGAYKGWAEWLPEPGLDRVVDGVPNGVDRIEGLGNAIVPQVAARFMEAIKAIEEG